MRYLHGWAHVIETRNILHGVRVCGTCRLLLFIPFYFSCHGECNTSVCFASNFWFCLLRRRRLSSPIKHTPEWLSFTFWLLSYRCISTLGVCTVSDVKSYFPIEYDAYWKIQIKLKHRFAITQQKRNRQFQVQLFTVHTLQATHATSSDSHGIRFSSSANTKNWCESK